MSNWLDQGSQVINLEIKFSEGLCNPDCSALTHLMYQMKGYCSLGNCKIDTEMPGVYSRCDRCWELFGWDPEQTRNKGKGMTKKVLSTDKYSNWNNK